MTELTGSQKLKSIKEWNSAEVGSKWRAVAPNVHLSNTGEPSATIHVHTRGWSHDTGRIYSISGDCSTQPKTTTIYYVYNTICYICHTVTTSHVSVHQPTSPKVWGDRRFNKLESIITHWWKGSSPISHCMLSSTCRVAHTTPCCGLYCGLEGALLTCNRKHVFKYSAKQLHI